MPKRNRVVVTGMGVLAPNGTGLEAFWDSLLKGRSGIGPITLFDAVGYHSRIAGEVKNFEAADYIEAELKPKRMARHTQLAYAATMMALADAGLDIEQLRAAKSDPCHVIGVSMNAMDVVRACFRAVRCRRVPTGPRLPVRGRLDSSGSSQCDRGPTGAIRKRCDSFLGLPFRIGRDRRCRGI